MLLQYNKTFCYEWFRKWYEIYLWDYYEFLNTYIDEGDGQ